MPANQNIALESPGGPLEARTGLVVGSMEERRANVN